MNFDLAGNVSLTPADYQRIYLNQCKKEGLTPAIKHLLTGEIFIGNDHRDAYRKRREKLPDEGNSLGDTSRMGTERRYKQGFIDEGGDFFTRDEIEKRYGFRYSETEKEEEL